MTMPRGHLCAMPHTDCIVQGGVCVHVHLAAVGPVGGAQSGGPSGGGRGLGQARTTRGQRAWGCSSPYSLHATRTHRQHTTRGRTGGVRLGEASDSADEKQRGGKASTRSLHRDPLTQQPHESKTRGLTAQPCDEGYAPWAYGWSRREEVEGLT